MSLWSPRGAFAAGIATLLIVAMPAAAYSQEEERSGPGETVTIAGNGESGYSGDGGDALDARLGDRLELGVGPNGEVYIADTDSGRVREITPEGTIHTVEHSSAGDSAEDCAPEVVEGFQWCPNTLPHSVASDANGTLHIASDETISTLDGDGESTVIAGGGDAEDGGDGESATEAGFYDLSDIEVDAEGNVYVADRGLIRMIDPDGTISDVAGDGETSLRAVDNGVAADDVQLLTSLSEKDLAVDVDGNLYFTVGDIANVFRVDPDGDLTTVVGTGEPGHSGDGGPATDAEIGVTHAGLAVDSDGTLYIGDADADRVRKVDPDGTISTLEGRFSGLQDIALGPDNTLYVAGSNQVSMHHLGESDPGVDVAGGTEVGANPWADLSPGEVATVAGTGAPPEDEQGPEVSTGYVDEELPSGFRGVAADDDGNVYFTERGRHDVRRAGPDGSVETVVGKPNTFGFSGDGGPAIDAELSNPSGLAADSDGTLVIADEGNNRIREVSPDGTIETTAGNGETSDSDGWSSSGLKGDGGPATDAELAAPRGVAVGGDGVRYIADSGNNQIHRVDGDGEIATIAGNGERYFSGDGGIATDAQLYAPADVTVDDDGDVYLTDSFRHSVRKVGQDGTITTIAGSGDHTLETGGFSGDGGDAAKSTLNTPTSLAADPDGTIYVADTWNNRIRRIDPDGTIDTVVGSGAIGDAGDGGDASQAELGEPTGVAVSPDGGILVADSGNRRIRQVGSNGTIDTMVEVEGAASDDTDGVPATEVDLGSTLSIATASDHHVYIADQYATELLRMDAVERTISPMPQPPPDTDEDRVPWPVARATTDESGNLIVASVDGAHRVDEDGTVTTIAGGGTEDVPAEGEATATAVTVVPEDVTPDGKGGFYLSVLEKGLYQVSPDGTIRLVEVDKPQMVGRDTPARIASDRRGNIYVADTANARVTRVADDGTTTKVAGTGEDVVVDDDIGDGGPATDATVRSPSDIEVADDGTLYIAEMEGVRRVTPDGTIDTLVESDTEKDGSTTTYHAPRALALDDHGNLYFTVPGENEVRVIAQVSQIPSPVSWTTLVFWVVVGVVIVAAPRRRALAGWVWRHTPSPWADRLRRFFPPRREKATESPAGDTEGD